MFNNVCVCKMKGRENQRKKRGTYMKNEMHFPLSCFLYCYTLFIVWPIVMHPSAYTLFCYGLYNQIQPKHFPRFCYHEPSWSMLWGIMGKEVRANWIPYIFSISQHWMSLRLCALFQNFIYTGLEVSYKDCHICQSLALTVFPVAAQEKRNLFLLER